MRRWDGKPTAALAQRVRKLKEVGFKENVLLNREQHQLSAIGTLDNPSAVGLLKVEDQQVPVATSIVHRRQYRTTRDAVIAIHKMIRELESQGVVCSRTSAIHRRHHCVGNTAVEVFEKGEKIIRILLEAGFAIKKNKVKGPAREIQFLGIKWEDGRRQIPTDVINKITAMSPPTNKKETRGRPLGFWSRSYRGSEANYTPTEKEILAAYEGVRAASEVIGMEAQLLLVPRLPVLGWMFRGKVPSTHHATSATWSKWIALIVQRAQVGKLNRPGILEVITNWPEGESFSVADEEQEPVTRVEEAPPYDQLPAEEICYALFTDGSCRVIGMSRRWKAAVWSPTRQLLRVSLEEKVQNTKPKVYEIYRNPDFTAILVDTRSLYSLVHYCPLPPQNSTEDWAPENG
ncbi:uncharacterized protein FYW23_015363 [Sylvia borin]